MYQTCLFDLDGTLTDPGIGITNAVAHALKKCGIPVPERSALYPFIGPPLLDSFARFYGMNEAESLRAVEFYREYYRAAGIHENVLIPGTKELLSALKGQGKTLILATSKPQEFAEKILDTFDLTRFFDYIAGATFDASRSTKAAVIRYALEQAGITDVSTTVMVGDREHDVLGARENGLGCIGVLFGYGSREELERAGARHLAEKPLDILTFV
ncbi:MAG: HAD family hydrolase [Faecousia sp.]